MIDETLRAGCARAIAHSRFVARALAAEAGSGASDDGRLDLLCTLAARPLTRHWLEQQYEAPPADDEQALARQLRRLRRRTMLALAARDIAGEAGLTEVVGTVTALAEFAVGQALRLHARALAQRHGVPLSPGGVPQDLLVVAMGKGGGGELNVSSDLDLVFVYDEDGETAPHGGFTEAPRRLSNHEFFERLGKRLIAALSEATADGFVFRVDMRLRPHGDAGPLAVSGEMLEEYLLREGRDWERFAWLKGRVISGPVLADAAAFDRQRAALESLVRPFVFRKYLDFSAIASLRELHEQIRAQTRARSARRAGGVDEHDDNVKLGRGGIREIEFIAQTQQVIRGGRDARLRDRGTLPTLATLARIGVMPEAKAQRLAAHYVFLRQLEHALQYVDDAQTHQLPADPTALAGVASMLRLPSAGELRSRFDAVTDEVAAAFDAVFQMPAQVQDEAAAGDEAALLGRLRAAGADDASACAARLRSLLESRRVLAASSATRSTIERLLVLAVAQLPGLPRTVSADEVLARLARLLEAIAGRSTYIALLGQYGHAFERVLRLLAASRWATDYLVQHPILLDELLDERLTDLTNASPVDFREYGAELRAHLAELGDDVEAQMNMVRDEHHAQVFRLLVADLDGRLTVERLADHLSLLADTTLAVVLEFAWRTVGRRHLEMPRFAVIGYGKLGGKEMGYQSDLDLVFVSDDGHPDAMQNYVMLARRLMSWLTSLTSSGSLFDVDLRLRPDGDKGLLVAPVDGLERYQRREGGTGAWTWEHQALTRARFVAGDAAIGSRFERLRNEVLAMRREPEKLAVDVLDMRRRMLEGHPNRSGLFDLKHDRGGMVDVEFIVQYLVLAHSHGQPRLLGNLGNIALLRIAGELGLLDARLAAEVGDAYRRYRKLQHELRLNNAEFARVPADGVAAETAAVRTLWRAVFGTDAP
ncbi:MAG: bifunctional [glutamate--ammonia ligase]-adenylyl-L-tyrosine phosphorylase/[glutamate--ammonia-ligase] adenylyltransferase [Burkholderiaceae bacterium]|jgi:glutamate-ammonia-ligase adenylyltransferase|nr:bifunctional [glutamate--ammonia ligase]-adenylyl-L-tyrosine phosphorylase/[glutamate--ammonia-ligase] adenylyltransferase [Burkholderiaceae bacterium]